MTTETPEPDPVDAGMSDRILGDFRLLHRIGVGGMAEVYLAEQQSLTRMVAVKILQQDAVSGKNDTLLRRFEQEARAAGGLNDSNIVQVLMIGHEDGLHYIVQEYVRGPNLSQWFKKNGCPDFLKGLGWMKQVASALKAASDAGIVHRDIKPENIMLTPSGDAKVTDFGLAQLNETDEKLNLTQQGTTMGTPWYMSPEQIQGEKLDHRSDQYSFGITCYHMFAGQPPFPGKNSVSVAVKHLKDEPRPLSEHRRDLPGGLCQLIHRLMSKRPEDRFESPGDLLDALDQLEDAPLNPEIIAHGSAFDWVKASIPSMQFILGGLLLCFLAGAVAGRKIFQPSPLPPVKFMYPQMDDASEQYAKAILDRYNPEAWKAVFRYWSKSEEAVWSRLQLGIYYLNKDNLADSEKWFQEAYDSSLDHRRELQLLSLVGQAAVAEAAGNEEVAYRIQNVQLAEYREELRDESILVPERLEAMYRELQGGLMPPEQS